MRIKQDAVPGMDIPVWWVPTVTTEQMRTKLNNPKFVYEIACAQLCGIGHSGMRAFVTVDDAATFQTWMDEQVKAAQESGDDVWQ
jgi:cytochrome c oxidase subunit 2